MRRQNRYAGAGRRRGQVFIYTALGMGVWMACSAMVIDMGWRYFKKAEAQRAADAAALAAVAMLPDLSTTTGAAAQANYYAGLNGYLSTDPKVTIKLTSAPGGNPNRYQVYVAKQEPSFFAGYFTKVPAVIGAIATAEYLSKAPINITGGGTYGSSKDIVNLSVFGPKANYNNGDPYDPLTLPDGSANPQNAGWNGYDFGFSVPSNYKSTFGTSNCTMEVFDPDCYNAGGSSEDDGSTTFDELRDSSGNAVTGNKSTDATAVTYTLYWDNNTPNDLTDDVQIGQVKFGAETSTYDMKWDQMFTWDTSKYVGGEYRMNVLPTAGSSENGFDLRAGPPHATTMTDTTWSSTYGTKAAIPTVTASGNLEINFNTAGSVNITLGYVDAAAAGGNLYVNKFDTDVSAKSIVYTCDTLSGTFPGTLSSNGTWQLDTIALPSTYKGGTWSATYAAGSGDTSVWTMSYSNYVPGIPGVIHLVQ